MNFEMNSNSGLYIKYLKVLFKSWNQSLINSPSKECEWYIENNKLIKKTDNWQQYLHVKKDFYDLDERKKVLVLGESVALTMGIEPYYSFSTCLQDNLKDYQVLDMSKASIKFDDLLSYINLIKEIRPQKVILYAGNNTNNFEAQNAYLCQFFENVELLESFFRNYYKSYISDVFLNYFIEVCNEIDCELIYILPGISHDKYPSPGYLIKKHSEDYDISNKILMNYSSDSIFCPGIYKDLEHYFSKLGDKKNTRICRDRSHFLRTQRSSFPAGINYLFSTALKDSLTQKKIDYLDTNKLFENESDRFYGDYCHLNLVGLERLCSKFLQIYFNTKLTTFKNFSVEQNNRIQQYFYFSNLNNTGLKQEICQELQSEIDLLFDDSPLFINSKYHELLMEQSPLLTLIAHFDYKGILGKRTQNENEDILNLLRPCFGEPDSRSSYNEYNLFQKHHVYSARFRREFKAKAASISINIHGYCYRKIKQMIIVLNDEIIYDDSISDDIFMISIKNIKVMKNNYICLNVLGEHHFDLTKNYLDLFTKHKADSNILYTLNKFEINFS